MRGLCFFLVVLGGVAAVAPAGAQSAAPAPPNILVVWGDDVGQSNISAYTHGMVGYQTPNIDRIANEGMAFTDYYGEQSCTAGRAAFIMGQSVFRTGLSKVGLPGADLGMRKEEPTIAGLLKAHGYATGQFGKNHLGDRDEHLPTNHGFDEFYGNLYHLNAEEEPENLDYPKAPEFRKRFGPRGVIHSWAQPDGTQKIEDTGPLTKKRMETVDDETSDRALAFMQEQHEAGKPFFVWWSGTRMHFRTHVKPELRGISGQDEYADGMVEHDTHVGKFLKKLDELGIAGNTIVLYSTDNGPHYNTWPDAAATPFRGEKNTNWEGGWRVPAMVRWPGKVEAGTWSNQIVHHMDWLPTFLAAAGEPDIKGKLKAGGVKAIGRSYKVHLDGYNLVPHLTRQEESSPRKEIFYFSDDGDLTALRYQDWKVIFLEQKATGTFRVWQEPFVPLRVPLIENLRRDPYERATPRTATTTGCSTEPSCWFRRRPTWPSS
jgi:arylsulfatase